MKILISERLSQNKYKTPEGYLVCVDAILSRTGKQQYRKSELFQDCQDSEADMIIDVDRSDKEVFSEQAMASFENKPVTIEHPSEYVTPDNFNELSVGYLRDIHKGMYEGKPVMLGTLVLTNVEAIEKVESGELTNLSCGYDADCIETTHGYEFVNIRGNHLALCETPRAGITHIVDSVVNDAEFKHLTDSDKVDEFLQYGHGLQLEDDSIAFYEELKERFPEHATTIQDIIDEELKHVGQLNELREKINARINKEINAGKQEAIKEDSMKLDGLTREEKELCDYMLENALDDDKDENDLLRKMKAYYSEYSNLARRKSNDVLNYFKQHINDSMKVHDSILEEGKTYITRNGNKLTVKKLYAGYSDHDGKPTLQIDYAYQKTDGKKGTSRCSSYDFFNMMSDKVYDSMKVHDSYYDTDEIDRYGYTFRNLSRKYSSKLKFKANGRFTHIEGQKSDIKDFLDDCFGPNMGPYSIRDAFDSKMLIDSLTNVYKKQITEKNLEDSIHDSKVKDNRRIEYDDDIIKVALNGKVVFKGYAEEWCDDNFYDNFRWTGSQYEATNSQGKWIVKVVS